MRKALFLFAVLSFANSLWAADPFIGTWKLNIAKSKAPDPSLLPKSEVFKNVAQGNFIKTTFDGVDSRGKSFHSEGVGEWNGKDVPVTGDPFTDTTATKRLDANTLTVVNKKAGKEVASYHVKLSKDGKTMTAETKFRDEKGKEQSVTFVYDKQ